MPLLGDGIADGWGIGYPEIDLKLTVALLAEFASPHGNRFRSHEKGAARSHSACVGDGDRERWRTCSGHGREQNGQADAECRGERFDAGQRRVGCGFAHRSIHPIHRSGCDWNVQRITRSRLSPRCRFTRQCSGRGIASGRLGLRCLGLYRIQNARGINQCGACVHRYGDA